MKENNAKQIENMKLQTIGAGIEMYGISRHKAAKKKSKVILIFRFRANCAMKRFHSWALPYVSSLQF